MEEKYHDNNSIESKTPKPHLILVAEDDEGLSGLIQKSLQRAGFHTKGVANGSDTINWIVNRHATILLLDYRLPDMTGREVIETLYGKQSSIPFIVITGHGDEKVAVEMMKLGARDYLIKDVALLDLLPSAVKRVFEQLTVEKELANAEQALKESEEKNRALIDVAGKTGLGIVIIQNIEDREGAVVFANDEIAMILGYLPEDMLTMSFKDFLFPDVLPAMQERYRRRQQGEDVPSHYEITAVRKDGATVVLEIGAGIMTYQGRVATVAFFREITERKRFDDMLEVRIEERTAELLSIKEELQLEMDKRREAEEKLEKLYK